MKGCLQNEFHHLDVWGHTLEAVRRLEGILSRPVDYFCRSGTAVDQYCSEEPVKRASEERSPEIGYDLS